MIKHHPTDPKHPNYVDKFQSQIRKKPAFVSKRLQNATRPNTSNDEPTITRDEQYRLADFLAIGMSLAEARTMKQNEDKLATIKQQAREMRREAERGAIMSRGSQSQTRFGPGSQSAIQAVGAALPSTE